MATTIASEQHKFDIKNCIGKQGKMNNYMTSLCYLEPIPMGTDFRFPMGILTLLDLWVVILSYSYSKGSYNIRGDRGYVGHFLVFQLSNVFKDEIRKNKSIPLFLS